MAVQRGQFIIGQRIIEPRIKSNFAFQRTKLPLALRLHRNQPHRRDIAPRDDHFTARQCSCNQLGQIGLRVMDRKLGHHFFSGTTSSRQLLSPRKYRPASACMRSGVVDAESERMERMS